MKTNKIFKNILSLLTLGFVVFSCNKQNSETPKTEEEVVQKAIANIESIVFTKAKNSTPETSPNDATAAYKALFITKTPAPAYAALEAQLKANIEADGTIKVTVPFNTKLNISTAAPLTATITLKEKLGENVYLGNNKKLYADSLSFDHVITTQLVHAELIKKGGVSQTFKISKKEGDKVIDEKSFKVVFVHDTPSTNSVLATSSSGSTKTATGLGFIKGSASAANEKIKDAATAEAPATYPKVTDTTGTNDGSAADKPILLTMTKNTELADETISSFKFKADKVTLPNGAYFDTTDAVETSKATDFPATDPTTEFTVSAKDKGISFKVIAQDGTSVKFYRLEFKE
ncbi:glutathione S-transferase family protein [Ichthyobacterium seriolicida]|uniref:Lipoprotein n=1 Tax=Ichthyobacterium seriolicida TaxID=242600 RepID=A0A1J1EBB6_9FLAO|nr:hypothetical protein [Ichthyobacterium seriolicida]BAV95227.1 hypothetical protein JBKA6_1214 [Ichthyobacterium seriolicida]